MTKADDTLRWFQALSIRVCDSQRVEWEFEVVRSSFPAWLARLGEGFLTELTSQLADLAHGPSRNN